MFILKLFNKLFKRALFSKAIAKRQSIFKREAKRVKPHFLVHIKNLPATKIGGQTSVAIRVRCLTSYGSIVGKKKPAHNEVNG